MKLSATVERLGEARHNGLAPRARAAYRPVGGVDPMPLAHRGGRQSDRPHDRVWMERSEDVMDLSTASIGQVMIPVDDFERGLSFYKDTLGLPFLFAAPPQMAFFMCGSVRLLVGVVPQGQSAQRGSAIYFKVQDIHSVAALLKTRKVNVVADPHLVHRAPTSELWLAEFTDPDGNHLALMSEVPVADA